MWKTAWRCGLLHLCVNKFGSVSVCKCVCVCFRVTENNEPSDRYMNDDQYAAQRETGGRKGKERGDEMKARGEWMTGGGRNKRKAGEEVMDESETEDEERRDGSKC